MPKFIFASFVFCVWVSDFAIASDVKISDSQIRQKIIEQSIASYPGNCPCPYSIARNGSSCGGRSAYSKPRGYSPICYPGDVTQAMIQEYRRRSGM